MNCSRPGSGARATGPAASTSRPPAATASAKRGIWTQTIMRTHVRIRRGRYASSAPVAGQRRDPLEIGAQRALRPDRLERRSRPPPPRAAAAAGGRAARAPGRPRSATPATISSQRPRIRRELLAGDERERLDVLLPRRAVHALGARRASRAAGRRRRARSPPCGGRRGRSACPGSAASWSGRPEKRWSSSRCRPFSATLRDLGEGELRACRARRRAPGRGSCRTGRGRRARRRSASRSTRAVGDRAQLALDLRGGVVDEVERRAEHLRQHAGRDRRLRAVGPVLRAGVPGDQRGGDLRLPRVALERGDARASTGAASRR